MGRFHGALLFQRQQICHQVVDVVVGVLREQVDVGFGGSSRPDLHFRRGPGAVTARGVAQRDGEFVLVGPRAADGLAGGQRDGHLRLGSARIHQALEESQTRHCAWPRRPGRPWASGTSCTCPRR